MGRHEDRPLDRTDFAMSTDNARDSFVVAGIPFSFAAPALITWASGAVAAVAAAEVKISPGVTVTVDVADPASVLAWTVDEIGDPATLTAACEAPTEVAALIDRVGAGESASDANIRLRPAWARKALVVGVSQWMPNAIHEGALILDQAAAHQATGESFAAARLVALGAPVLEALVLDCEDGLLSTAAVAELAHVADLAATAVDRLDWGTQVRGLADRVDASLGISDMDIELVLEQWRGLLQRNAKAGLLAGSLSAGDAGRPVRVPIDLAAVTARILRWVDANTAELNIVETTDGADVVAELSIEIAETVDERGREVSRMSMYAADERGALLSTARAVLDGRTLRGTLRFPSAGSGGAIGYGVFDIDYGIGVLRASARDADLIEVDRKLIDAWSRQRAALAVTAQAGGADSAASELLSDAIRLTDEAHVKLNRIIRATRHVAADHVAALTARLEAVSGYREILTDAAPDQDSGGGPLLSELVPTGVEADVPSPVDGV